MRTAAIALGFATIFYSSSLLAQTPSPQERTVEQQLEQYLSQGKLQAAHQAMKQRVEGGDSSQAQYGLAVVQVLQAVENLAQNLRRYGLKSSSPRVPFMRLPVPENPQPERITYEKWRGILQQFVDDLQTAQDTLKQIDDADVKLKVPVGLIRLDLNGDGKAAEEETFWQIFTAVAWRAAKLEEEEKRFEIGFDKADVHWLTGYTHLLQAMAEAWLAHDTREFFNYTASIFFAGAPQPPITLDSGRDDSFLDPDRIADAIAAVHLARFEVAEPQRMRAARDHLLAMVAQSRTVFKLVQQETDDDREWIPNAEQTSLTPLDVTQERIEAWRLFLREAEAVLNGEKLLPHWRLPSNGSGDGEQTKEQPRYGINLKRVFTEPRQFDLVMWVHGAAALPYVEQGEVISQETANTLNRTFQGRFVVFAIWFQ